MQDEAERIAQLRSSRSVPSAVEAASKKLEDAALRLDALRKMYAKEVGLDLNKAGLTSTGKP